MSAISGLAAPLLEVVDRLQVWLPDPVVGSLLSELGGRSGTPGVGALIDTGDALVVTVGYAVVFTTLGAWLLQRRDLT